MRPAFGSLFAGIGGFDLGLERAGWRCAWPVEADPACRSVLRRHFPGIPIYEDVREVGSDLESVDLVCGGFPCQDVSVAGKRAGLAGARSGLWWEFHRILAALSPRWALIENVAGLLSSNGGRDLGAILGGLAELGYVGCYRVLDSQHFGVAQRRRRVFIVGHLGTEPRPEVLSLAEGVSGHPPPSREAGARPPAGTLGSTGGEGRGWRVGADEAAAGHVVAAALTANYGKQLDNSDRNGGPPNLVMAAQCHGSNVGPMGTLRQGNGNVTGGVPFVAQTLTGGYGERAGQDLEKDGAVLLAYSATDYKDGAYEEVEQAGPLTTSADRTRSAPIAFSVNRRREGRLREVHGSLNGEPSGTQVDGVLTFTERGRPGGRSLEAREDGIANALITPGGGRSGTGGGTAVLAPMFVHPRILRNSLSSNQVGIKDDGLSDALTSEGPGAVMQAIPRRLTPRECESLQAFPRDWTAWGLTEDGERVELSDSARYRQLGNAVTVTVAAWIGSRVARAVREAAEKAGS